jgi:carboxypeptidase C (cathepsin A)
VDKGVLTLKPRITGDADYICNWYGNKAWTERLAWTGKDAYNASPDVVWRVAGEAAGEAKTYRCACGWSGSVKGCPS